MSGSRTSMYSREHNTDEDCNMIPSENVVLLNKEISVNLFQFPHFVSSKVTHNTSLEKHRVFYIPTVESGK